MRRQLLLAAAGALASLVACTGRTGPSPNANLLAASDGAYGGSFPATGAPYDDEAASDPPPLSRPNLDDAEDEAEVESEGADAALDEAAGDEPTNPLPDGACVQPLTRGALRIDELMIASVAGAGDDGEWIEIESTLDCAANLDGLHGECPRGAKVATFDVTGDLWIPPRGTFLVADSSDPAINHDVPGIVVPWFGHSGDVLRNEGTTLTVSLDGTLIDTVTYPALPLVVGVSLAFPEDCDPSQRSDFTKWKRSTASWFPGFLGTPNAPNTDVTCP
jgi:hypothetical protein